MNFPDVFRAVLALMVAIVGALSARNGRKLRQVHVLVNSNLAEIKARLERMTEERDQLRADAPEPPLQHLPQSSSTGFGSV
jgi:hypothetical protein